MSKKLYPTLVREICPTLVREIEKDHPRFNGLNFWVKVELLTYILNYLVDCFEMFLPIIHDMFDRKTIGLY